MRQPYVHAAEVVLAPGSDHRAPGGAVTVALCGHWEHDGPCRWPHHIAVEGEGQSVTVRTVFISDPAEEALVRARIAAALDGGRLEQLPAMGTWAVFQQSATELTVEERSLAGRLAAS